MFFSRAGGGYNAAPNGSLICPSRRVIPPIEGQNREPDMGLRVAKITADMAMPTPPPFPQEQMSPGDSLQWNQQQTVPQSSKSQSPEN